MFRPGSPTARTYALAAQLLKGGGGEERDTTGQRTTEFLSDIFKMALAAVLVLGASQLKF